MQSRFFQPDNPFARTAADSQKRKKRVEVFSSAATPGYLVINENLTFPEQSQQLHHKPSSSPSNETSSPVFNSF